MKGFVLHARLPATPLESKRAADKPDPLYYARLTVQKTQAEIDQMQRETGSSERLESTPPNEPLNH